MSEPNGVGHRVLLFSSPQAIAGGGGAPDDEEGVSSGLAERVGVSRGAARIKLIGTHAGLEVSDVGVPHQDLVSQPLRSICRVCTHAGLEEVTINDVARVTDLASSPLKSNRRSVTHVGPKEGDALSVRDLLYALLLPRCG